MEFELPKINVSFEYDEEKDEMVFVINGVEKRVKTEDMITEMEKLQEQNTALEQEPKILDTLDFAIDASNGDTNYFVGFRNGLRYSKSLIDGKEPQFESCAEQEPCEECISRKDAINAIKRTVSTEQIKALKRLPSVQPKPKTGHWIIKEGREQGYDIAGIKTWYIQIMCDKCGFIKTAIEGHIGQYHFCPNCGAKMESEDKE